MDRCGSYALSVDILGEILSWFFHPLMRKWRRKDDERDSETQVSGW